MHVPADAARPEPPAVVPHEHPCVSNVLSYHAGVGFIEDKDCIKNGVIFDIEVRNAGERSISRGEILRCHRTPNVKIPCIEMASTKAGIENGI